MPSIQFRRLNVFTLPLTYRLNRSFCVVLLCASWEKAVGTAMCSRRRGEKTEQNMRLWCVGFDRWECGGAKQQVQRQYLKKNKCIFILFSLLQHLSWLFTFRVWYNCCWNKQLDLTYLHFVPFRLMQWNTLHITQSQSLPWLSLFDFSFLYIMPQIGSKKSLQMDALLNVFIPLFFWQLCSCYYDTYYGSAYFSVNVWCWH